MIWCSVLFFFYVKNIPKPLCIFLIYNFPRHYEYYPVRNKTTRKYTYATIPNFGSIIAYINISKTQCQTIKTTPNINVNNNGINIPTTANTRNTISNNLCPLCIPLNEVNSSPQN